MTFSAFVSAFVRVPHERTGVLGPMALHPAQARFVEAVDALGVDGMRRYRTFLCSWPKKSGKSTTAAALALYGLVADDVHRDREVIIVATDLGQAADVIFQQCARIAKRHPWLASRVRPLKTELVFVDDSAGYRQEHVLRALPRDVRGLHGTGASATIFDEVWTQDDYDLVESLTPSPARQSPITALFSYAGLRSQQRKGVPWFDLLQRAHEDTDPNLYCSHLSGPEAWREVPWLTQRWVNEQRRLYETVPSKFVRLIENRPAPADDGLLSAAEVREACDGTLTEPARGESGVRYVAALDLGLTHDWTALVIGHVREADAKFVIDVLRTWRGAKGQPVSLTAVEHEVVALAKRFPTRELRVDQWQATGLIERLQRQGLNARPITIEPTALDRFVTRMKAVFTNRQIAMPATALDLIEQLENLTVRETGGRNRRRDLLRFDSGSGPAGSAAAHDDLAIALAICLDLAEHEIGRQRMHAIDRCLEESHDPGALSRCFLSGGFALPVGPCCAACEANRSTQSAWRAYNDAHPTDGIDLRGFVHAGLIQPCPFITARKVNAWLADYL